MGILKVYAEIMDEAPKLEKDYGLSYHAAIRKAKEMFLDKKKVAPTPASFRNNDTKTTDYIIAESEDIDNNEIYDIDSGQTIRDL
ncbi:MAG: hypothetical protein E7J31_05240 [Clostridium sp.]|uniref:hypothetical protein n=1 Tax=Clostridium sp. TaxID=1506 RepID=UPI00290A754E|nr:hypothetical protein [Clostridium sp.]MDU7947823.1 hypothetical protein [Clostridium sp.]